MVVLADEKESSTTAAMLLGEADDAAAASAPEPKELSSDEEEPEVSDNPSHSKIKPSVISTADYPVPSGFFARRAKCMARNPWCHFIASLIISVVLSTVGIVVGEFSVAVDNAGWQSRGTLISDRHAQVLTILIHENDLATGNELYWSHLEDNIQGRWESEGGNRRLVEAPSGDSGASPSSSTKKNKVSAPFVMSDHMKRLMQESPGLSTCNTNYYSSGNVLYGGNLWPLWKTKGGASALDARVIRDICVAEQNTQAVLQSTNNCITCGNGQCYPPFSIVFYARLTVGDTGFELTCDELSDAWAGVEADQEVLLRDDCVEFITIEFNEDAIMPDQCPVGFAPTMVDEQFGPGSSSTVAYTSSVFSTHTSDPAVLYEMVDKFDRAESSSVVIGAYDTKFEDFNEFYVDVSVGNDMILAMGSAAITAFAILLHTRSPWLTIIGLLQIILSFPLAFFVYTFIARLEFFPFLNFIGVFVVFALGADDIFVAVDKWKNARIDNRRASLEDIAAIALPDAAHSMFLTTATTAVAFFGTAICPVAPLKCFAVFCGLLILFDYLMCILLIFPALCIYDKWLTRGNNFCCAVHLCRKQGEEEVDEFAAEDDQNPSLIRRILTAFYNALHKVRWVLLAVCVGATITSIIFAAKLELPKNSDVRLLSESLQYEQNYLWRNKLLYTVLGKSGGAPGVIIWGMTPADTGNRNNPDEFTQLVLDDTFNPAATAAQEYLVNFCDRLFAQDFAGLVDEEFVCPINRFDNWLQKEANTSTQSTAYSLFCEGATGLPMDEIAFGPCVSAWTNLVGDTTILERSGVVQVMYVEFQQRVRFDSQYNELRDEWNLIEDWLDSERKAAPYQANKMYHSSGAFWWYDTNGKMLQTAFGAAGIALGFSGIVVLVSSRSFTLTLFSIVTIGYVLTATTALLVATGWTLGFLESVCFAILIGISCDFVIHFGHTYASLPGVISRHERTKYALIRMGPSILAAALTTVCAAIIMLFTVISFFQQFAQILFFTVIQATAGTFIFFLTLTDCIGPSEPTVLYDKIAAKCCGCGNKDTEEYSSSEALPAISDTPSKEGSSLGTTDKLPDERIIH